MKQKAVDFLRGQAEREQAIVELPPPMREARILAHVLDKMHKEEIMQRAMYSV